MGLKRDYKIVTMEEIKGMAKSEEVNLLLRETTIAQKKGVVLDRSIHNRLNYSIRIMSGSRISLSSFFLC